MAGWGWAWVGIRDAGRHYDAGALALGRYLVASLVLLPVWVWRGAKRPARSDLPVIACMGLLGFTLYNLSVNIGEQSITAGTAAFIAASIPVMLTLGGRAFFNERLTPVGWVGVMVALTGVGLISIGAEDRIQLSYGALLVLFASVCAAGYGLLNKRLLARYGSLDLTTWAIWAGTLGLVPTGRNLVGTLRHAPLASTLTVILLGVLPGAICYALWSRAMSATSLSRVSSSMFLVPLMSVGLGWLMLGEVPAHLALVGGMVTLGGVFLVNTWGHAREAE